MFLLGTLETGGSETKFVRLARRLSEAGMPVHVGYLDSPDTLLSELKDVNVVSLHRRGKWSIHAYQNLASYIARHKISTVVSVNLYPLSYAIPMSILQRERNLNVIVSINTSEILSRREEAFMHIYRPMIRRCGRIVFGSERQRQRWLEKYRLPGDRSTVIYNGVDGSFYDNKDSSDRL